MISKQYLKFCYFSFKKINRCLSFKIKFLNGFGSVGSYDSLKMVFVVLYKNYLICPTAMKWCLIIDYNVLIRYTFLLSAAVVQSWLPISHN